MKHLARTIRLKKLVIILGLITATGFNTFAQIGVDNPTPNPYSSLDLKATDKGLLVPRMTTAERFSIKSSCSPSCPDGLLVYDNTIGAFFYMKGNTWYALSPFDSPDATNGVTEDINTNATIVKNLGVGASPTVGYKLDVNGKTNLRTGADADATITVTSGNVVVSSGFVSTVIGDIKSTSGDIKTSSGDIKTTSGKISASGFSSDITATNVAGPVPQGGIIMWSGPVASIPAGWQLCDGSNGSPDLSGRFVLGAGARKEQIREADGTISDGDTKTFAVDNVLGADQIILSVEEMPAHEHSGETDEDGSHRHHTVANGDAADGDDMIQRYKSYGDSDSYSLTTDADDGNYTSAKTSSNGKHTHTFNTDEQGADDKSYNMPPYYVLAYIMKK